MDIKEATAPEAEINIEAIMAQIRAEIRARRAGQLAEQGIALPAGETRLPPEFYEHLHLAEQALNQFQGHLRLAGSGPPLIGPLLNWLRRQFHQLVLFYVNESAARQIEVNRQLLQAITLLGQEVERLPAGSEPDQDGQRTE